ncbi:excision nuclease subunit A [Escherichia coli]|uniref:Excision nuclease subunit A n=1 Tax=Escherichia coli TaxID=562 RepID=A0A376L368_ECOLX|nr:excision nuclease subunit A [Escherichia coli]
MKRWKLSTKAKTIHEVLDMTIEEAREFFDAVPALARKLQTLMDVGLTYIRLGSPQPHFLVVKPSA